MDLIAICVGSKSPYVDLARVLRAICKGLGGMWAIPSGGVSHFVKVVRAQKCYWRVFLMAL